MAPPAIVFLLPGTAAVANIVAKRLIVEIDEFSVQFPVLVQFLAERKIPLDVAVVVFIEICVLANRIDIFSVVVHRYATAETVFVVAYCEIGNVIGLAGEVAAAGFIYIHREIGIRVGPSVVGIEDKTVPETRKHGELILPVYFEAVQCGFIAIDRLKSNKCIFGMNWVIVRLKLEGVNNIFSCFRTVSDCINYRMVGKWIRIGYSIGL